MTASAVTKERGKDRRSVLFVRMDEDERAALAEVAERNDRSVSAEARRAIREYVERESA